MLARIQQDRPREISNEFLCQLDRCESTANNKEINEATCGRNGGGQVGKKGGNPLLRTEKMACVRLEVALARVALVTRCLAPSSSQ